MFETNIKKQLESQMAKRGDLRSFRWTDLVAKLSATRDVRAECEQAEGGGFAGFAETRRHYEGQGKRSFNQSALSDGKGQDIGVDRRENGRRRETIESEND